MQWSVVFLSFIFYFIETLCDNSTNNNNYVENNLKLLGYIYGSEIDKNYTFKYPQFLVTPLIVIPVFNHNVTTRKNDSESRVQNGPAFFGKILLDSDNDIEVKFRQALERGTHNKTTISGLKTMENLNQTEGTVKNYDFMKNASQAQVITFDNSTSKDYDTNRNTTSSDMDMEAHNVYPNANYNNHAIHSLSITVEEPNEMLQTPFSNEKWKNFSASTNINLKEHAEELSLSLNITNTPSHETESPIIGVYGAARYDNTEVEQLSITTNYYKNVLPLPTPQDDRWKSSALIRQHSSTSNEFRPLAGLYYDGFLYKPIPKTQSYMPYNHYP